MMTSVMPVATVVGCYAIVGLVPTRSQNVVFTHLKIEAWWTILNIDTRSCARVCVATEAVWVGGAHVQAVDTRVVGQAMHA
jgi:hypothetical protein